MPFDGIQGQEKPFADFLVRKALSDQAQDFQLAWTEWFDYFRFQIADFRLRHNLRLYKSSQEFVHVNALWVNAVTGLLFNQKSKIQNQQSHWLAFVHKKTDEAARFGQRQGGYSRIVRLGPRQGDGAEQAMIELVGSELVKRAAERAKRKEERLKRLREGKEAEEGEESVE